MVGLKDWGDVNVMWERWLQGSEGRVVCDDGGERMLMSSQTTSSLISVLKPLNSTVYVDAIPNVSSLTGIWCPPITVNKD